MRLIECHIVNFGTLRNITISFEDGLNIFARDNGWGKSTLAEFIKVMFFGFDNESKRDGYENKRKRYTPWQGGIYGGSITFETGEGKDYTVFRQFGNKAKDDVFELRCRDTGMVCDDFSEKLGEELFGINSDSFARTVFISQGDGETETTGEVISKMSDGKNDVLDIDNYETAAKKLSDCLNKMSPDRKTGMLYKLKDELVAMKIRLNIKDNLESELAKLRFNRNANQAKLAELAEKKNRLYAGHNMNALVNEYNILKNDVLEKKMLLKEEEIETEALRRYSKVGNAVAAILAFLLAAVWFVTNMEFIVFILLAAVLVILIAVHGILSSSSKKAEKKLLHEIKIVREQRQAEYERSMQKIDEFEKKHSDIFDKLVAASADDYKPEIGNELATIDEEEKRLIYENNDMTVRISELARNIESLDELYITYREKQEEYDRVEKEYEYIFLAEKLLKKAKESYSARYISPVKDIYRKYYTAITGKDAEGHCFDADVNLTVLESGLQRDKIFYSRGLRDLMGICMRLALVDVMFENEAPFIIMDDTFVNLDEKKYAGAHGLLKEISSKYQIIYFTCRRTMA